MSFSALLGLAASCGEVIENDVAMSESTESVMNAQFVPGQLLIKYRTSTKGSRLSQDILEMIQANVVEEINTSAMEFANARKGGTSGDLLLVESKMGTREAIERLRVMPEIEYAEPNWIYPHQATSNDPYFTGGLLWGCQQAVINLGLE